MKRWNSMNRLALSALLLAVLPTTLLAKGDPAAGQSKSQVCQACHGLDGKSIAPIYPNLAGQHEDYLVKALADYRAGRRTNAIMAPMAANLSDQDIEDLAAWYASQDGLKDLSIQ
jgi:cytochrome c553